MHARFRGMTTVVFVASITLGLVSVATAQTSTAGAIAGIVRDTSGGVLPGVTVEAASPALIEKVRSVISDSQGNYKIVDLRPGTYTVSFTLPGFSVVKRDGIELTSGFTANVNADMTVGSLEETITVSGATPVVDIQNTRQQTVLSRDLIDTLPTDRSIQGFAALTLGANVGSGNQDVGGTQGDSGGTFGVHGSRGADQQITQGGMLTSTSSSTGGSGGYNRPNQNMVQEMTIETGGVSAEAQTGGVQINVIPKEGGNKLSFSISASGSHPSLQSQNLTDKIKATGLTSTPDLKELYDYGGSVGGPFLVDRVWGYIAYRKWGTQSYQPGNYYNATQGTYIGGPNSGVVAYTPDLSRPAYSSTGNQDLSGRITWQVNSKDKLAFFQGAQQIHNMKPGAAGTAPEAAIWGTYSPSMTTQALWTRPHTSRLLFEGGVTFLFQGAYSKRMPGVRETDIPIVELSTGLRYGASGPNNVGANYSCNCKHWNPLTERFAVSYITGSHVFKVGINIQQGWARDSTTFNTPSVGYSFRNGVPQSILEMVNQTGDSRVKADAGFFVQDQWTLKRLTLNMGARLNYFNAFVPAAHIGKQLFVTEEWDAPAVYNVPNYTDFDPRFGLAYDLFGNGKTAIKASMGRYVALQSTKTITIPSAPLRTMAQTANRTWGDADRDYIPDCDLSNPFQNGECGQVDQLNIGKQIPSTIYADDVKTGFGNRAYSWQGSVSLTQQLRQGMALNVGYFRTSYGNFSVTANQAVSPADFDSYCVTAPTDSRLGDTSGQRICGLYDVKPASFGRVTNVVTQASNFGKQTEVYSGFDISLNSRFGQGGLLQGGVSTGTTVTDNCDIVQNHPEIGFTAVGGGAGARTGSDFCRAVQPMAGQTQYKFAGNYPLPWLGLQFSATYQNLPGAPIAATLAYTNAQIAPSLGRNLSAGANSNVTIALMKPYSSFQDRVSQFDVRVIKNLRFSGGRVQLQLDAYNLFNSATVLTQRVAYGSAWLQPQTIMSGRVVKFGIQSDF
jgi:hypothetical protein